MDAEAQWVGAAVFCDLDPLVDICRGGCMDVVGDACCGEPFDHYLYRFDLSSRMRSRRRGCLENARAGNEWKLIGDLSLHLPLALFEDIHNLIELRRNKFA